MTRRLRRQTPALAFGLMWLAGTAAAQTPSGARILVMPFAVESQAGTPGGTGAAYWLGEAAAILLSDEFSKLGLGAFSRDERVAAFDRLQIPLTATLTHATMIRVGELVGASDVLLGSIRVGERLTVRARMIRLDTGRQFPEVTGEDALVGIFPLFERMSRQLAAQTGKRIDTSPRIPVHPPLEAFENYVKGLVAAKPPMQQRFLEAALRSAPRDGRVLVALWSAHTAQGAHDRALAAANQVPAESPFSRRARFCAALSLIELNRLDAAFKALAQLETERATPVLSNALGVVQLRRGSSSQTGTATYYFNRAVDREPDNTDYLFNLGYAYAIGRDPQAAVYWLRETVRHDPANGDAHLVMSAVLLSGGKTVEAQRELDLAKQLGTRLETATLTLGDKVPPHLERLPTDLDVEPAQRIGAALEKPAQREQQETASYHVERGRRQFELQNDREAINELRRAVYLSPYEDESHLLLGRLYLRAGRLSDAIDEFKIANWCRETVESRVALGAALLESGDRAAARREAERALVLKPDSAEARELLKRLGGLESWSPGGGLDLQVSTQSLHVSKPQRLPC